MSNEPIRVKQKVEEGEAVLRRLEESILKARQVIDEARKILERDKDTSQKPADDEP